MRISKFVSGVALAAVISGTAVLSPFAISTAHAATYDYVGNFFTLFVGTYYDGSDRVTGSVTFNTPLPDNFGGVAIPDSYSFSDGVQTLDSANSSIFFDALLNNVGNFINWDVQITSTINGGNSIYTIYGAFDEGRQNNGEQSGDKSAIFGNGSWSTVATTPLPSTWLMLLSGFVGLGYFAYRGTKKRTAALAA